MNRHFAAAASEVDPRVAPALRGETLYGDDFNAAEIAQWFEDEREGYFNLGFVAPPTGTGEGEGDGYAYQALAQAHCYRWLPTAPIERVLGIGSATGAELAPLARISNEMTVLEPSDGLRAGSVGGKPVTYVKPVASGVMPFESDTFDLVVCFSVLHHIPNVSTVVREMARVLKPGGYALLREPTHSMGDWRSPRRGLTSRERGIPLQLFRRIIADAGFEVIRETRCMFSLTSRLSRVLSRSVWTYPLVVGLDGFLCRLGIWPSAYHARAVWQKLRPTAVAYVLRRPPRTS